MRTQLSFILLVLAILGGSLAFTPISTNRRTTLKRRAGAKESDNIVVELGDEPAEIEPKEELPKAVSGPLFISQGEVDPDTLNPDFSDAKQTRVIIYTILSLLPVLFLIPFMLGRDFIPADSLPPVDIN